jgi:hyperosmotically inducible protein
MHTPMPRNVLKRSFEVRRPSMKATTIFLGVCLCCAAGCDQRPVSPTNSGAPGATAPDNTATNVRDRAGDAKTALDQNENQADIDITAGIRKRVVDSPMSINAHNIKIITQDKKVTLRGPVDSADEKQQIERIAHDVAGEANVDNQLEIAF